MSEVICEVCGRPWDTDLDDCCPDNHGWDGYGDGDTVTQKEYTLADVEWVAGEKGWEYEPYTSQWFRITQYGHKPITYKKYIKRRYRGWVESKADRRRAMAIMTIEEDA